MAAALNCRPGEMAVVIAGEPIENLGRIVKVLALDLLPSFLAGTPMWTYEGELLGLVGIRCRSVADNCLKPIRDQDPDAVDEMVEKVGPAPRVDVPEVAHG